MAFDLITLLQPPPITRSLLLSLPSLLSAALSLRLVLLLYGIRADTHSALKYTDVDYLVFTDAARALAHNLSPYTRATYRYTPLLAWLLQPTTWEPQWLWFHSGKVLFALADVLAGWLLYELLLRRGLTPLRARGFASLWLLNPLVAVISTRGSSEGLLCALVLGVLWAVETRRVALAGALLGLAVHLKIYPFIYGASLLWALETVEVGSAWASGRGGSIATRLGRFLNPIRSTLLFTSLASFSALNMAMWLQYGFPFVQHTYLHHVTRLDHRHNFSVYNTLLYLRSASSSSSSSSSSFSPASLAFIPQLLLSTLLIPLSLAKPPRSPSTLRSLSPYPSTTALPLTFFAQTLAFTTFNKVLTSQYFLWSLVFLPLVLPGSVLLRRPVLGVGVLGAWVLTQAAWLGLAFQLEMGGVSVFGGLWGCSVGFFASGCWILGVVVADTGVDAGPVGGGETASIAAETKKAPRLKTLADEGVFSDAGNGGDDGSDVEEIVREVSVEEAVEAELRRTREGGKAQVLREYVEEMERLM